MDYSPPPLAFEEAYFNIELRVLLGSLGLEVVLNFFPSFWISFACLFLPLLFFFFNNCYINYWEEKTHVNISLYPVKIQEMQKSEGGRDEAAVMF